MIPPLRARTCDPSTEQSSRSNKPARRSSVSKAACRRGYTPASVQSRSRRQAVTPEQPTASAGTSRHATPVRSTYMTPASATRSGTRSRPGWRRRRSGAGGSSGATRSHRASGTRSTRTLDTLLTSIAKHKACSSIHSETISYADRPASDPADNTHPPPLVTPRQRPEHIRNETPITTPEPFNLPSLISRRCPPPGGDHST